MFRSVCALILVAVAAQGQTPSAKAQEARVRAAMNAGLRRQQQAIANQARVSAARHPEVAYQPLYQPSYQATLPSIRGTSTPGTSWVASWDCDRLSSEWLNPEIERTASENGLSPVLLRAVASTESAFVPCAVSPKGAAGLMQIMPDTARYLGLTDPMDPKQNLDAGARYLKTLLTRYGGNLELALSAYNAGPGRVDAYGGVPPISETQSYVRKILSEMKPDIE